MDRTMEEVHEQETRDTAFYYQLLAMPDPFASADKRQRIRVNGVRYSPHWLLCYAQARHKGIACMQVSGYYANQRCFHREFEAKRKETHTYPEDRETDLRLLYLASLIVRKQQRKQSPVMAA